MHRSGVRRGLLLAAVCAAALWAPAAQAQPYAPALAAAIAVASAHWPQSPCRGREVVIGVTRRQVDEAQPGQEAGAYALLDGSCTVMVAWEAWHGSLMRLRCRVLVHEFGHLAGLVHNSNPRSVMYGDALPDIAANSWDCWHRFYRPDAPQDTWEGPRPF